MTQPHNENGWNKSERDVYHRLGALDTDMKCLSEKLDRQVGGLHEKFNAMNVNVTEQISGLKGSARVWGIIAALAASAVVQIVVSLLRP